MNILGGRMELGNAQINILGQTATDFQLKEKNDIQDIFSLQICGLDKSYVEVRTDNSVKCSTCISLSELLTL